MDAELIKASLEYLLERLEDCNTDALTLYEAYRNNDEKSSIRIKLLDAWRKIGEAKEAIDDICRDSL